MAYFAKLSANEGPCLIYDSMVRRALKLSHDPDITKDGNLATIRRAVLSRSRDLSPREQEETYGTYITALARSAEQRGIDPAQLELALFREGRMVGKRKAARR